MVDFVKLAFLLFVDISRLGEGAGWQVGFLGGANEALLKCMNFIVCLSLRGANFTNLNF